MNETSMNKPLHELAAKVGANMGWEWHYNREASYEHSAAIVGPDGMTICLSSTGYARLDRIEITGRYPVGTLPSGRRETFDPRSEDRPAITCAAGKPVTQIARDILHRFLPTYQEQYRIGLQRRQEWLDAHQRQAAVLDRLAEVLGSRARRPADGRDREDRLHLSFPARSIYGHLEVSYQGDTVSIEARYVPAEVAEQIAAILATC